MKSIKLFITVGILNVIHGFVHIFQFIQSIILSSYGLTRCDTWLHRLFENPIFGLFWAVIGIVTLLIGYRDYKHHKQHKN